MALAENIRHLREKQGMSMEELAGSAEITRQQIEKYEHGKSVPGLYTALKIAKKLNTTCEELAYGKTEQAES